ncbi:MAG: Gfo/Idh/MocA family oxidoreductase, partial [Candidatus Poribacteria bacterium]|nr:Gfo/Idh/MocA family oxidoreductase [Candidatus Poribacteria bacterium]
MRIALVGCGGRGLGVRLPAILLMSDVFELAAICDVDGEKARKIGAEHGVLAYSRLQDLVAHEKLDIAAISTPADSHHAIGDPGRGRA